MPSGRSRKQNDPLKAYERSYAIKSRLVGVIWGIFSAVFAAVTVLAFVETHWIGADTGRFGLYVTCTTAEREDTCQGRLSGDGFDMIPSIPFKIATVFAGLAVIFSCLCVLCFLLFFCIRSRTVYIMCGVLQIFTFICLSVACVAYPFGWESKAVKNVCGEDAGRFALGSCEIQWTYIMAIVGIADAFFLGVLAFVLAMKELQLPTAASGGGTGRRAAYNGEPSNGALGGQGSLPRGGAHHHSRGGDNSQFSTISAAEPAYANRYNAGARYH